jgi:hypothetical protein
MGGIKEAVNIGIYFFKQITCLLETYSISSTANIGIAMIHER